MSQSLTEIMSEKEEAFISFYEQNPGASWVDAAEAFGMDDKEAFGISIRLTMYWKVLIMKREPMTFATFTVKETITYERQALGDEPDCVAQKHLKLATKLIPLNAS